MGNRNKSFNDWRSMDDEQMTVTKNKIVIGMILFLAFFLRFYPHMFVIDNIGFEEGNMIFYTEALTRGEYTHIANLPHAPIFLAALLYYLLPISLPTACYLVAPILGTLSTYLIYDIMNSPDTGNLSIYSGLLFATLDVSVYRSSLFGTSGEALGIFLLLLTIRLYQKYNYKALPLLLLLSYVHIIVFMVGCAWAITIIIYDKYNESKINTLQIICLVFMALVFGGLALYFGPHRLALVNIIARGGFFDPTAIIYTLTERMIPQFFGFCLGSGLIWSFWLILVYQKRLNRITALGIVTGLILLAFFMLSSSHISPYRIFPYLSILSIFSLSQIKLPHKKTVVIFIASLMVFQMFTVGYEKTLLMYDSPTDSENKAVDWLKEYDSTVAHYQVFTDDMGKQLLLYSIPSNLTKATVISMEEIEIEKESWKHVMNVSSELSNNNLDSHMNTSGYLSNFKYILYSERLGKNAIYISDEGFNQNIYVKLGVNDVWKESSYWDSIYEKDGVIIYERL